MRFKCIIILFFGIVFNICAFSQSWINLKYPQSDLLGVSVYKIENNEVIRNPTGSLKDFKFKEDVSVQFLADCTSELKKEIDSLINQKGFNVSNITIFNLKIRRINDEDIYRLDACNCFVYEGMSADKYELSIKKNNLTNKEIRFSTVLESLRNPNNNLLSSIEYIDSIQNADNVIYDMKINSPDVYFKIRMIRFNNTNQDSKFRSGYFFNNRGSNLKYHHDRIPLQLNVIRSDEETTIIHPGSKQKKEFENNLYKLVCKKQEGRMKLFLYYKENTVKSDWIHKELISDIDKSGYKHWGYDEEFINNINNGNFRKSIYFSIYADQVSDDKINITNYVQDGNNLKIMTGLKYMDGKIEYVNEKTNCLDNQEQILED